MVALRPGNDGSGARGDRLDDVVIPGAAAEVAFELVANGRLVRLAATTHDVERHHDHAGGAVAALKRVMRAKGDLHRMERRSGRGQSFDGGHVRALALQRQDRARLGGQAVDMYDARATLRGVAADVRSGEPQPLSQ